jgi:hypothetical protein
MYRNAEGLIKKKIGRYRTYWEKHSHVLTGGSIGVASWVSHDVYHPKTGFPLTIRERARIQGCPDDFIFEGPGVFQIRQTGKFMPVQFCEYLSRQIAAHLRGESFESNPIRLIKQNSFVNEAKRWYCENAGYGRDVCGLCGSGPCHDKQKKVDTPKVALLPGDFELMDREPGPGNESVQLELPLKSKRRVVSAPRVSVEKTVSRERGTRPVPVKYQNWEE